MKKTALSNSESSTSPRKRKTAPLKNSEPVYSTENLQNLSDLLRFFQYHYENNPIDDEKAVVIRLDELFDDDSPISNEFKNEKNVSSLDSEISKFFSSLATNTHIKKLHIDFRNFNGPKIFGDVIIFDKFVSGIKRNQTLEEVKLEYLYHADMKLFFENLETTKIKRVLLNQIGHCDFSHTKNISKRIFELSFKDCHSVYVNFIGNALKNNEEKNIQKFSIKNPSLNPMQRNERQSYMHLIDTLGDFRNLKVLELDHCGLDNEGLQKIAEMVKKKAEKNEFLEELSIMGNEFYDFEIFLEIWFNVKKIVHAKLENLITTIENLQKLREKYPQQNSIWTQCTIINFDVYQFLGMSVNASKDQIRSLLIRFPFSGSIEHDMKIASVLFEGYPKNIIEDKYNQIMDHFVKLVVHNPIVIQSANKGRTQKLFDISDIRFKNRLTKSVNLMAASEKTYPFCEIGSTRSQNKIYSLNEKMAIEALKTGINPYTQIKIKPCHPEDPEIEALVEKMIQIVKINEGDDFMKDVDDRVQKTASFLEKNSLKRTLVKHSNEKASKKQKTALMLGEIQEKKKEILFNKNDCENEIHDLSKEAFEIFRKWKEDVFTMGKVFFPIPPRVSAEFARSRPCNSVVLYRGMSWREKYLFENFLKSKTFKQKNWVNGQEEIWITDEYKTFHSWTFDFFVAKNFAQYDENKYGIILECRFQPEDIVADFTKFRSYNIMDEEKEIIVRPMKLTCKITEIIKDKIVTYEDENMELVSFLEAGYEDTKMRTKMSNLMKKNFDPNTIVHNLPFYWHLMMKNWNSILDIVLPRIDTTKNTKFKNSSLIARLIDFLENVSDMDRQTFIYYIEKNFEKVYKTPESKRIVFQESGDDVHCWFLNQINEKRYDFIFRLFQSNMNGESVEDDAHASFWRKFLEPLKINILVNNLDFYEAMDEYFRNLEEKPFNETKYKRARSQLFSLQNEIGTGNLGLNFETEFKKYFYYKSMDTILKTFVHEHFHLKETSQNMLEIRSSVEKNVYIAITLTSSPENEVLLNISCLNVKDQVKSIIFERLTNKLYNILKREYNFIVVKQFHKNQNNQDELILKLIANPQDQEKVLTTSLYHCISAIAALNFDQYKINPNKDLFTTENKTKLHKEEEKGKTYIKNKTKLHKKEELNPFHVEEVNTYVEEEHKLTNESISLLISELESEDSIINYLLLLYNLSDEFLERISKALKKNKSVKKLTIGQNILNDKNIEILFENLKENNHLEKLYLRNNNIGDIGAKAISNYLEKTTSLKLLNIENNQIGDQGASDIAKALEKNRSVNEISLENNQIGDNGAIAIAKALKWNNRIEKLQISLNKIGLEGIIAIMNVIIENHKSIDRTIRYLRINGNLITDTQKKGFEDVMKIIPGEFYF